MGRWVVFGKVVSFVEATRGPVEIELALGDAIFEPVVAHVESFGTFHADLGFEDVVCGRVVGFERSASGRLWMAHLGKGGDDGNSFLGGDEETAGLGFRCRGLDTA